MGEMKWTRFLRLFFVLILKIKFGSTLTISDAQGLIVLSTKVNKGTTYSGTTVILDADIDFTEKTLEPMGKGYTRYFGGTFDGQGHTISNLKMNSASQFTGLFGYSEGFTVKNLVIDESCSFVSSFSEGSDNVIAGSVIGICSSVSIPCAIEDVVNMGSLEFTGNTGNNLYIGGIVGYFETSSYPNTLKNCVNYGSVTHSGESSSWVELGGIVGISSGMSTLYNFIQNCANYGTIAQSGSASTLAIGEIAGVSYYTTFESCVSSGKITNKTDGRIGGIAGRISSDTEITHCYWTDDTGCNNAYGAKESDATVSAQNSSLTMLNQVTLDKLNEYITTEKDSWNKWVMLHLNGGSINNISQENIFEIQKHFPNPVVDGNTFMFWCKDSELTEEFDPETDDISTVTDLYAKWPIINIATPDEFVIFSVNVNIDEVTYDGLTVLLGADIDFSGAQSQQFEPIGKDEEHSFRGTFDGQGHKISNLEMNSSAFQNMGLFGYSEGLTIKNLVVDESCSVTSSYEGSDIGRVGGIIGRCIANEGPCIIENIVNMGIVASSVMIDGGLDIAGIAASFFLGLFMKPP